MRFDAVFFDSGGTLYKNSPPPADPHTDRGEVEARRSRRLAHALQGLGYSVEPEAFETALKKVEQSAKGRPLNYTFADTMLELLKSLGLRPLREDAALLADAYAGPRYAVWLYPGTLDTLRMLSQAGVHVGLIANTAWPSWSMDRAFHGVGLLKYLATRVYSGDEGIVKPDPVIFKLAAARSGIAGKRFLYVGDSVDNDVKGARGVNWASALKRTAVKSSGGLADFEFDETPELISFVLGK